MKTVDFSETIKASDPKVSRSRHLSERLEIIFLNLIKSKEFQYLSIAFIVAFNFSDA